MAREEPSLSSATVVRQLSITPHSRDVHSVRSLCASSAPNERRFKGRRRQLATSAMGRKIYKSACPRMHKKCFPLNLAIPPFLPISKPYQKPPCNSVIPSCHFNFDLDRSYTSGSSGSFSTKGGTSFTDDSSFDVGKPSKVEHVLAFKIDAQTGKFNVSNIPEEFREMCQQILGVDKDGNQLASTDKQI